MDSIIFSILFILSNVGRAHNPTGHSCEINESGHGLFQPALFLLVPSPSEREGWYKIVISCCSEGIRH